MNTAKALTTITFKEMPTTELRDKTLNLEDLTPFGRFVLNGNTTAVFNGQFIDLYHDGRRYYQFGYTPWINEEYYGDDGLVYVKEGYELIG